MRVSRILTAAAAAVALSGALLAAPSVASAAPALAGVAAAPSSTNAPQVLVWSPYDGSRITTEGKCLTRMHSLQKMRPDLTHWDCWDFTTNTCPSRVYWLVMVATNGARVATPEQVAVRDSELAAAC